MLGIARLVFARTTTMEGTGFLAPPIHSEAGIPKDTSLPLKDSELFDL